MIKEIRADQLRLGMCVCSVSKPSADSSYHHNKFFIKDQNELDYLLALSEVFYIDSEAGLDVVEAAAPAGKDATYYFKAYVALLPKLNTLFERLRQEKSLDFNGAKAFTQDLMALVIDNPALVMDCCWEKIDPSTYDAYSRESMNVAIFCLAMGWHLGLSTVEVFNLGLGALIHDIGITQVPDAIINKPGALTPEERAIIEQHTLYGVKLLGSLKSVPIEIKKIVLHHHERFDGQGYPAKLKGEAIDWAARLVGMVSVFEALTRDRAYCLGLSPEQAMQFLHVSGDTMFDQQLVEQFTRVLGIYPEGAVVELSSGHLAFVTEVDNEHGFMPKLKILTDEHKNLLDEWAFDKTESDFPTDVHIQKLLAKNEPILPLLKVYLEQCS